MLNCAGFAIDVGVSRFGADVTKGVLYCIGFSIGVSRSKGVVTKKGVPYCIGVGIWVSSSGGDVTKKGVPYRIGFGFAVLPSSVSPLL
mmetsp:Transcript_3764/g.5762  ORF Transcript_3764/g.5762 Transcript_3764/m.5762 type:complete len:88 (-) Transcript_3764:299-562(-)